METMKYSIMSSLSKTKFRRYTGLSRDNFEIVVLIIEKYEFETKEKGGRPCNLSIADQVLMLLEYYRENRTLFHLGISYGLHESNIHRTIIKLEDILMHSGYFRLEGKKALLSDKYLKTILIDVTETLAQRPKKNEETRNQ